MTNYWLEIGKGNLDDIVHHLGDPKLKGKTKEKERTKFRTALHRLVDKGIIRVKGVIKEREAGPKIYCLNPIIVAKMTKSTP